MLARADEHGRLRVQGGRVEIRYRPDDARAYRASPQNLAILDATPLPDDACAPLQSTPRGKAPRTAGVPHAGVEHTIVYADGACSGNPGPAGSGVVILREGKRIERYEYLGEATNNIAELTAILRALDELAADERATIYTDSEYAIGVVMKNWKAKANAELVAEVKSALSGHPRVDFVHVRGHAGIELNELADKLARRAIQLSKSGRTESPSEPKV